MKPSDRPPTDQPPSDRPPSDQPPSDGSRPAFWRSRAFWVTVAVLLLVNWLVGSSLIAPESRLQVPYTEFGAQVSAGNVKSVTSKGETIQGDFGKAVTYPEGSGERSTHFQTQRPSTPGTTCSRRSRPSTSRSTPSPWTPRRRC